jgi:hypothetical protein
MGMNFYAIPEFRHPTVHRSAQGVVMSLSVKPRVIGSFPAGMYIYVLISDIGIDSDVNIGPLPISE